MPRKLEMVLFPGWVKSGTNFLKLCYGAMEVFSTHAKFMWPSSNIWMPIFSHRDIQRDWVLEIAWEGPPQRYPNIMTPTLTGFLLLNKISQLLEYFHFRNFKYALHLFHWALSLTNVNLLQKVVIPRRNILRFHLTCYVKRHMHKQKAL